MELLRDTLLDLAEGLGILIRFVLYVAMLAAVLVGIAVFVASL